MQFSHQRHLKITATRVQCRSHDQTCSKGRTSSSHPSSSSHCNNQMACFKCGQGGHVAVNCPQSGHPPTAAPPLQGKIRGPCWACGKKGHFAKECRSKPRGNGKGRGQPGCTQPPPSWNMKQPSYSKPSMGHGASTPITPSRNDQLCRLTNGSVKPICTSGIPRTAPWGGGPWVALAMKAWE